MASRPVSPGVQRQIDLMDQDRQMFEDYDRRTAASHAENSRRKQEEAARRAQQESQAAMTPEQQAGQAELQQKAMESQQERERQAKKKVRKGMADSVPDHLLTPEQRERKGYHLYQKPVPHLPGTGYHVWDQRLNDGEGGYADRAPDPHVTKSLGPNATVEDRAHAMGIDHSQYSPEMRGQLEADVAAAEGNYQRRAKHFNAEAIPGGGHRWVPNQYTVQENARQRSEKFLEHEWAKWQREARADNNGDGKPDYTFQDFQKLYYGKDKDGVPLPIGAGDPEGHIARVRRLRDLTRNFSAERSANIQENIETRAKQDNMARRLGVHPGHMVMHGDLMNARSPEDLIRTLLAYHNINPGYGYGNMAAYVDRNQADMQAAGLAAGAAQERNKTGFQKSQEAAAGIPVVSKPEDFQAWRDHYRSQAGTAANPKDEAAHVVRNTTSAARNAIANINTPGSFEVLQTWTQAFMESNDGDGRKDYDAWLAHLGQHNGPRMRALWERLTGKGVRTWGEYAWERMGGEEPTAQAGGI